MRHCGVAVLGKGMPFPADRALHWRIWEGSVPVNTMLKEY